MDAEGRGKENRKKNVSELTRKKRRLKNFEFQIENVINSVFY
jgi:hypothetical protein